MCVGLPGKVVEVGSDGASAVVDVHGARRTVSLVLMPVAPQVGDWVVVQLGFAMERMTETEAIEALELLAMLEAAVEDGLSGPTIPG
jgi:hydrogenase assembly chaperone HypC/HupF